jgi:hypothetical protein
MGRTWLRALGALWLVGGVVGVGLLLLTTNPIRCDCPSPPCYTRPGGARCDLFVTRHPYAGIGVFVLLSVLVGSVVLWRLATKRRPEPP